MVKPIEQYPGHTLLQHIGEFLAQSHTIIPQVIEVRPNIDHLNLFQGSLEEWLRLLRLEEYGPCLESQGYSAVQEVATISIEDLEDTGFYRLGHQKRLTLGIRRLKELSRGGGGLASRQPLSHPPSDYYGASHSPQYIAQAAEIRVEAAAPLAVKPGSFSSFSSPYPQRKAMGPGQVTVEHHVYGQYPGAEQAGHYSGHRALVSAPPRTFGPREPCDRGPAPGIPEPMAPLQYPLYKQGLSGLSPAQYPGSPR